MDLRMECDALEGEFGVRIKLIQIPEKSWRRAARNRLRSLKSRRSSRACLKKVAGRRVVDIKLTRFLPSLAEVPSKELEALQERL